MTETPQTPQTPESMMRDVVAGALLAGKDEAGTTGRSADGTAEVEVARNGDLTRIRLDPAIAGGTDVRRLELSILQAWRNAARALYAARHEEMADQHGAVTYQAVHDAIAERFREPTAPAPGAARRARRDDDEDGEGQTSIYTPAEW